MTKVNVFPAPTGVPQLYLTHTRAYVLDAHVPNKVLYQGKRVPEESWQFWYTYAGPLGVYKDHVAYNAVAYKFPERGATCTYPLGSGKISGLLPCWFACFA